MSEVTKVIPVAGPSITQREIDLVTEAAATGWYGNANKFQARFERAFADYIGVKHAVSLPSCTAGLHLALAALGVGSGDEVIVPDITWIASAAPVTYVGASLRFADIDEESWCMSPRSMEALISPRTKAVIPVDLYGNMARMREIREIADARGVAVIEDAAEAVGADLEGRLAGSWGRAGVYSFHGSKTLTTGEGGMLVTDDDELLARVLILRDHGRRPGDRAFDNFEVGFKYKMTAFQAAIGIAQLERIDELVERKREAFRWYEEELSDIDGITLNQETAGSKSVYWMVTAIVARRYGIEKDALQARLLERGIESRPFFRPLSSLAAYRGEADAPAARTRNRVAYALSPWGINLPSSLSLTREDVGRVGAALRDILRG